MFEGVPTYPDALTLLADFATSIRFNQFYTAPTGIPRPDGQKANDFVRTKCDLFFSGKLLGRLPLVRPINPEAGTGMMSGRQRQIAPIGSIYLRADRKPGAMSDYAFLPGATATKARLRKPAPLLWLVMTGYY